MWLILLVVVILAALGGVLGDLLQLAFWMIVVMVVFFAAAGFAVSTWIRNRLGSRS